jgi:hypothetical protein
VEEGFQVTPTWHQGSLRDNGRCVSIAQVSVSVSLCFLPLLGDELVVDSPGRVTWRRCRRRSGSTARGRPTAGATREASRRPLRDGWLRFLSLSLTGRSAWRAVSPQVRYPPLSQQLVSVRVSSLLLQFLFLQAGLSGAASGTSSKMRPRIRRRTGAARFR